MSINFMDQYRVGKAPPHDLACMLKDCNLINDYRSSACASPST